MTRAKMGMLMNEIASTALVSDGPKTAASMIAKSSAGKAKPRSASRITASSTQPPSAEASRPSTTPMLPPSSTATSATVIELRAAAISCATTSRPN